MRRERTELGWVRVCGDSSEEQSRKREEEEWVALTPPSPISLRSIGEGADRAEDVNWLGLAASHRKSRVGNEEKKSG
jgi:hypothetical protein